MANPLTEPRGNLVRLTAVAVVALVPWGTSVPLPEGGSVADAAAATLVVVWIARCIFRGLRTTTLRATWPLAAIGLLLVGFGIAHDRPLDVPRTGAVIVLTLFAMALADVAADGRWLDRLITSYWIGSLGLAIHLIIAYFSGRTIGGMLIVEGIDRNFAAFGLALGVVAAWHGVAAGTTRRPTLRVATVPLLAASTVLTASRSGFLALLIAAGYIAWSTITGKLDKEGVSRRSLVTSLISAVGLSTLVAVTQAPPETIDRITSVISLQESASSTAEIRPELWSMGLAQLAEQHYLIGGGPGSSRRPGVVVTQADTAVHNTVLEFAIEGGILALVAILIIAVSMWRRRLALDPSTGSALVALFAAWLAAGLTQSWMLLHPTWFVLGLLAGAACWRETERAPRKKLVLT